MTPQYTTRITLLNRARDQYDQKAWDEFISIYRNYIYMVVRSMNMNHHDSEDLMQQVIVKLWEKLPQHEHSAIRGKFRSWLSTITKNEVINFINKRKADVAREEKAAQDETLNYLRSINLPEIDQIAEREWKAFIANTAMENIQENFTESALQSFSMHLGGKSPAEIGDELDVSRDSVYKYITRIKVSLAAEIKAIKRELDI